MYVDVILTKITLAVFGVLVCYPGPKSLGWTSKRVDSRWSWWRTMIRFVSLHANKHMHTHSDTQGVC